MVKNPDYEKPEYESTNHYGGEIKFRNALENSLKHKGSLFYITYLICFMTFLNYNIYLLAPALLIAINGTKGTMETIDHFLSKDLRVPVLLIAV